MNTFKTVIATIVLSSSLALTGCSKKIEPVVFVLPLTPTGEFYNDVVNHDDAVIRDKIKAVLAERDITIPADRALVLNVVKASTDPKVGMATITLDGDNVTIAYPKK